MDKIVPGDPSSGLFAIFDGFYFRMFPAQENIFIEDAQARRKEKQDFEKIKTMQ